MDVILDITTIQLHTDVRDLCMVAALVTVIITSHYNSVRNNVTLTGTTPNSVRTMTSYHENF